MNCLYCYKPLLPGQIDYHPKCAKAFFGTSEIETSNLNEISFIELANNNIAERTTIAGVQAKLSLSILKEKNYTPRLTFIGIPGNYILKPSVFHYPEMPENEDLTMHLAQLCGIETAKHSLIRLGGGHLAYITKRFDRVKNKKLAMEDMCQLSENLTEHKYRGSMEMIGKIIKKHTLDSGYQLQKLFELTLFCLLTGNADMHLKNFSIIEEESGGFRLSPAYDLLNTKIILPDDSEEFALTINGKKNKIQQEDLKALADNFGISSNTFTGILNRFNKTIPQLNSFIEVSFLSNPMKEKYLQVLNERSNRLLG